MDEDGPLMAGNAGGAKVCSKCGETKLLGEFHRRKAAKDGRQSRCKVCADEASRDYYQKNREAARIRWQTRRAEETEADKERRREYFKQYRKKNAEKIAAYVADNPHAYWASGARRRAKSAGLDIVVDYSFTKPDVIERYGDKCFYCGGSFEELDHYVPISKGGHHTLDNARPCCHSCNVAKRESMPEEWLAEQTRLESLPEAELDKVIDAEIEKWA